MNFKLPDFQAYVKKQNEVSSLGQPTLKKAYLNGIADRSVVLRHKGSTYYERLIRDSFQIQVNNNRYKHEPKILTESNTDTKVSKIEEAAKTEEKIYKDYLEHVKAYKKGMSRKEEVRNTYEVGVKPIRKVKTELVFCFDASFGMYHLTLFKAINRFIDLINSIDLNHIDVAIVAYGASTNLVSDFSSNKTSLLLKTALVLPVGGVTVLFENFKFSAVSNNDLSKALERSKALFFDSKHATQKISRQIVVLSNGNLSGVVGQDMRQHGVKKELRTSKELREVMGVREELNNEGIEISSISLRGDNSNIIKELSDIIFWEESVDRLNLNEDKPEESKEEHKTLLDEISYAKEIGNTMRLNLYYMQKEQLRKDKNVHMA